MDERTLARTNSPQRASDNAMIIMAVVMVISLLVTTFGSMIAALGNGLASTPDHPVHWVSNAAWIVSGVAFIPVLAAFILTLASRQKLWGTVLALLILLSGGALILAELVGWFRSPADLSITDMPFLPVMLIPIAAGVIVLWLSRKLD